MRATEWGEEAWSVNREPMNKNRMEGAAEQGEWAMNHEALVTKAKRRVRSIMASPYPDLNDIKYPS